MLEMFRPGTSLPWDFLWQSCLFLSLGLAASLMGRLRPARAHRVLVLAILGALLTPILSQGIRRVGWGVLNRPGPVAEVAETAIAPTAGTGAPSTGPVAPPLAGIYRVRPDRDQASPPRVAEAGSVRPVTAEPPAGPIPWKGIALGLWAVMGVLGLARLAVAFARGFRLVRRSPVLDDAPLREAASIASGRLEVTAVPELRASARLRCPSVWCWGRRPVLLVPDSLREDRKSIDWAAIFCHELAHWRRRDHVTTLVSQLATCVLPWNPLAWWARVRLGQLAELACDDWVLAIGTLGTDYAESLLELVPQPGTSPALAAVSSRRGLVGRLRHILDEDRSSPRVGTRWALLAGIVGVVAAGAVALAQSAPGSASKRETAAEGKPSADQYTIRGIVLGPDGKPAVGADVFWLGNRRPPVPYVAMPRDDESRRSPELRTLARAKTDARGRFTMNASYNPADYIRFNGIESMLVSFAPGAGMSSRFLKPKEVATEVSVHLPPEVVVRGRLLTPAGRPAVGVRVAWNGFYNDANAEEGMHVGLGTSLDSVPDFWPRPRETDRDGRFVFENVPQGMYATYSFHHPDYAVDEVTVNATADGSISPGLKGFEIVPVKPTFTHALEPARPVVGRVTDKQTGKPLAGMPVEMIPMRRHGGMPFSTRTDADGRYRVSGHQADNTYFTTVYPPADSGYLAAKDRRREWPAGANALEVNFALERARLVGGRVIDRDTRQPLAGAAVVYQPARGNPNYKDGYDLRNTVLTDHEGRFTITALPGKGFLAVETPDEDYIRTPLRLAIRGTTLYPQGHAAVNVPKDGDVTPVDILVKKGVTLEARAIGPDGHLVAGLVAMYPGIDAKLIDVWNSGQEFPDGTFRIPGADPERTYRVFFVQPDRRLGTVAALKLNPSDLGPIEVRLQPTATVKGKLVNPGGSTPAGVQVYPTLVLTADRKELKDEDLFDGDLVQFYNAVLGQRHFYFYRGFEGGNGEFSFEALIPGARFYVVGAGGGRGAHVPVEDLKPGEVRDLGAITMKERKP